MVNDAQPKVWGYRECHTIEQWTRFNDVIRTEFMRYVADSGAPDGATLELIGLRPNSEGARNDRGELIPRIECDRADSRTVEVELRTTWMA
jgi:hypothetical protein